MQLKAIKWNNSLIVWPLEEESIVEYDMPRNLRESGFKPCPEHLTVVIDDVFKGFLRCPACLQANLKKSKYEGMQYNICLDCGLEFEEGKGEVKI